MTDIVERLRQGSLTRDDYRWEAADEIERLRAALRAIAEHPTGGVGCNPEGFVQDARAALEGPQDRMAKPLEGK